MKSQKKPLTADDYLKTSAINSMKLVRLVRSYEELYNSSADGYNDKAHKDLIWERISNTLFPNLNNFDDKFKEVIRINVRRRWKTLRNSIAREIKKTATVENYCRKKESPIISELEFLIPHIRSVYGTKFTEEMGLRENEDNSVSYETDEICEDGDLDDLIDLTEEIDFKPIIKVDTSLLSADRNMDQACTISPELFCPSVETDTNEKGVSNNTESRRSSGSMSTSWNKAYCAVAEYKEGEFTNSTVLCAEQDNDDNSPLPAHVYCEEAKQNSSLESRKRPRTELEDPTELQAKIFQLLTNLERREFLDSRLDQEAHDEDRMFLLSLVSDLKRVPAAKKMIVKAEIATSIAKAIQQ